MPYTNKVFLCGNLTRDPELRETPGGSAVVEFAIAINRRYKPKGATEFKEETTFIDIEAWRTLARICNDTLKKSSRVFVEGRLKLDRWKAKGSGETRQKIKVVADTVHFIAKPERREDHESVADAARATPAETT